MISNVKKIIYSALPSRVKLTLLKAKFKKKQTINLAEKILKIDFLESAFLFLVSKNRIEQALFYSEKYRNKLPSDFLWKVEIENKIMKLDLDDRQEISSIHEIIIENNNDFSELISEFILFYDFQISGDESLKNNEECFHIFNATTLQEVSLGKINGELSYKYFLNLVKKHFENDDVKLDIVFEHLKYNHIPFDDGMYDLFYNYFSKNPDYIDVAPHCFNFKAMSYRALKQKNYQLASLFIEHLSEDLESVLIKCRLYSETNNWNELHHYTYGKLTRFHSQKKSKYFVELVDYRTKSLFNQGFEAKAMLLWRMCILSSGFDSRFIFAYVKALINFEFYREAIVYLKLLLFFRINEHLAQNLTLKTLVQIGEIEKSYVLAKKFLKKDNNSLPAMQYLLTTCLLTYRHQEALKVCQSLISKNPTDKQLIVCCLRLSLRVNGNTELVRQSLLNSNNLSQSVEKLLIDFEKCVVKRGRFV